MGDVVQRESDHTQRGPDQEPGIASLQQPGRSGSDQWDSKPGAPPASGTLVSQVPKTHRLFGDARTWSSFPQQQGLQRGLQHPHGVGKQQEASEPGGKSRGFRGKRYKWSLAVLPLRICVTA